ncbi:UNVERIFIED_CONTAM: hypothetical protein RMT77_019809 [Armadillidium vulgare]
MKFVLLTLVVLAVISSTYAAPKPGYLYGGYGYPYYGGYGGYGGGYGIGRGIGLGYGGLGYGGLGYGGYGGYGYGYPYRRYGYYW